MAVAGEGEGEVGGQGGFADAAFGGGDGDGVSHGGDGAFWGEAACRAPGEFGSVGGRGGGGAAGEVEGVFMAGEGGEGDEGAGAGFGLVALRREGRMGWAAERRVVIGRGG